MAKRKKIDYGKDFSDFASKWLTEHPDQNSEQSTSEESVTQYPTVLGAYGLNGNQTNDNSISRYLSPTQTENNPSILGDENYRGSRADAPELINSLPTRNPLNIRKGISDIAQASREKRFTSPQIHADQSGIVKSREVDPITRNVLRTILSPGTSAVEGLQSAGDLVEESKKAFEKGDIGGGSLGLLASLLRGSFAVATPASPALSMFSAGSDVASQVLPEEVMKYAMQPVTSLTNPTTLAGRSGAEIGDVVANLLMAKGGEGLFRTSKKIFGSEKANTKYSKFPEATKSNENKSEVQNANGRGQEPKSNQPEYSGVPSGENLPANQKEVRQEESRPASGSSSNEQGGKIQSGEKAQNDKQNVERGKVDNNRKAAYSLFSRDATADDVSKVLKIPSTDAAKYEREFKAKQPTEKVISTAVRTPEGIVTGEKPFDSHDNIGKQQEIKAPENGRGFIVDDNGKQKFVGRTAAAKIAEEAGQIEKPVEKLHSEDLRAGEEKVKPLSEYEQKKENLKKKLAEIPEEKIKNYTPAQYLSEVPTPEIMKLAAEKLGGPENLEKAFEKDYAGNPPETARDKAISFEAFARHYLADETVKNVDLTKTNKPDSKQLYKKVLGEYGKYTLNSDQLGEYSNSKLPTVQLLKRLQDLDLLKDVESFDKKINRVPTHDVQSQAENFELLARVTLKAAESTEPTEKVSSTQVNIPKEEKKPFIDYASSIPEKELYSEKKNGVEEYGAEKEPHVTALYGLKTTNPKDVENVIKNYGNVELELGKTSLFKNDKYDVLKVDVKSDDLQKINKKLRDNLEYKSDFPDYKPHMTIAYLKPGEGEKYVGDNRFEGKKIKLSELLFSDPDYKKTPIDLTSQPKILDIKIGGDVQTLPEADLRSEVDRLSKQVGDARKGFIGKEGLAKVPEWFPEIEKKAVGRIGGEIRYSTFQENTNKPTSPISEPENKKTIQTLKNQLAIENAPSDVVPTKTQQLRTEAINKSYLGIINKLENNEPLNKNEQKVIDRLKLVDEELQKQKAQSSGKKIENKPIVKRALEETIIDMGNLSKDDKSALTMAVRKGILDKGEGGGFPKLKTVYAKKGYDFKAEREKQINELLTTPEPKRRALTEEEFNKGKRIVDVLDEKFEQIEKKVEGIKHENAIYSEKWKKTESPTQIKLDELTDEYRSKVGYGDRISLEMSKEFLSKAIDTILRDIHIENFVKGQEGAKAHYSFDDMVESSRKGSRWGFEPSTPIIIDVPGDGIFRLNHPTTDHLVELQSAIKRLTSKNVYGSSIRESLGTAKINDTNLYREMSDFENPQDAKVGLTKDLAEAKQNLETAKKSGTKTLIEVYQKNVNELEKRLNNISQDKEYWDHLKQIKAEEEVKRQERKRFDDIEKQLEEGEFKKEDYGYSAYDYNGIKYTHKNIKDAVNQIIEDQDLMKEMDVTVTNNKDLELLRDAKEIKDDGAGNVKDMILKLENDKSDAESELKKYQRKDGFMKSSLNRSARQTVNRLEDVRDNAKYKIEYYSKKEVAKKIDESLNPPKEEKAQIDAFKSRKISSSSSGTSESLATKGNFGPKSLMNKTENKGSDLNNVIRLREIGKNLSQDLSYELGKEVRPSRNLLRRFGKAEGYYFPGAGIVRLKNINDIPVLAHEIGHKLDFELFDLTKNAKFDKTNKLEGIVTRANGIKDITRKEKIFNTLRNKYGTDAVDSMIDRAELRKELKDFTTKIGHYSNKTEEGIAEFISRYVTEPETSKNLAPKFSNIFENVLDQNPNVKQALLSAREQVKSFKEQTPEQITESTIAREQEVSGFIQGIKKLVGKDGFFYNVLDATKPFRDLEKILKEKNPRLQGKDNPLLQVLSLIGVDGKAKQFLENHPFLKRGNDIEILKEQKPFFKIFHQMLKDGTLKEHEGYLTALRNIELYKNKKEMAATTTKEIAEQTIKNYENKFGKSYLDNLVNDLRNYNNTLLEYYKDSGKISSEQLTSIKELNQYYVPFKRFFDEWESSGQMPNVSKYIKDSAPSPVKQIRGSQREIVSPIGSLIKNTYDMIAAADRNTALKTLITSLKSIDKTLIQEIPARVFKRVKVLDPNLQKGEMVEGSPFVDTIGIEYKKPPNAEIVTVYEEGKPTYYQIPKEYYDSFFSINEPVSKAIRLMSVPSRILQAGAVSFDPTFTVRNIPRDQISAAFYSKYGYSPLDFFKGIYSGIGKKDVYQKFLASGADQSFLTSMDKMLSKSYVEHRVGGRIETTWQKYKRNPIEILQDLNRASELGTRIGAFRKAYLKTGDPYKAMQEGREISADYGVKGKSMSNISPLYPFFNARLQHLKMTGQAIKNNPLRTLAKGTAFITAPSIINWFANNSDEDRRKLYNELPTWRRYGFFNIPIPGTDSFLPIPKGFFGQLFGTTAEASLDYLKNSDPEGLNNLASQLFQEVSPLSSLVDIVPQFARPVIEQFANKKSFTGKPIVSERLKGLDPGDQYTDYTSQFSRFLGKALGISPLRLDAFIQSYTAGTGRNVLTLSDEILDLAGITEPSGEDTFTRLSKLPGLRAIVTETPLGTRGNSVQKFYEKLDELESISKTVNNFIKEGDEDKAIEYVKEREKDYSYYLQNQGQINKFKEALRAARDLRSVIISDNSIVDKRETIRQMEENITNIAIHFKNAYEKNEDFDIGEYLTQLINSDKDKKRTVRQRQVDFKKDIIPLQIGKRRLKNASRY